MLLKFTGYSMRNGLLPVFRYVSALGFSIRQKRFTVPALGVSALMCFLGYGYVSGQETLDSFVLAQGTSKGRKISPVAMDLNNGNGNGNGKNKNPDLVSLGSYLVNGQTGCSQCHTCPSFKGVDPYKVGGQGLGNTDPTNTSNYLGGGTPFLNGTVTSTNLTPDSSGLPGGLSYDAFKNAIQNGVNSHNAGRVLQVMPWPVYRNLTENDLTAIYQYLSAIPHAQAGVCGGPGEVAK